MEIRNNALGSILPESICGGSPDPASGDADHFPQYSYNFRKLPDELVLMVANVLPGRAILNLVFTNKHFSSLLPLTFRRSFQAIAAIEKVKAGAVTVTSFLNTLASIQAIQIDAQKPALLRDFSLSWAALSQPHSASAEIPDHSGTFEERAFCKALREVQLAITLPPQSLSDTLASIDISVACYVGLSSFAVCNLWPINLMYATDKAAWPVMLESLLMSLPAHSLKSEIRELAEEYDGIVTEISDKLAEELAIALFFVNPFLASMNERNLPSGSDVRRKLRHQFGVRTEAQWVAIDNRMALEVQERCSRYAGSLRFEESNRWRAGSEFYALVQHSDVAERSIL